MADMVVSGALFRAGLLKVAQLRPRIPHARKRNAGRYNNGG
jgi:hypothetical protein